ncbi:hypothetical protein CEUSTIGMA_g4411.t1 [Chlamydomonas eustigma]|uniref:Uncharacterized protein n=1 Tax=Chlamydomonas eustigma TaxID=1157962 RepID=A0A250X1I5_9CHLO|nr:hypothetical protein CEUSTIGMA_g4411.t1 [Chlamydomonas eustigma]|eukprot:GAX76964.1 hypothetical protein CEUSTIGMA_g4411.t1 [Chlamydomonas eustigma]
MEEAEEQAAAQAGRMYIMEGFNRTVQAAITIQRAFRAFKARRMAKGRWPHNSRRYLSSVDSRYWERAQRFGKKCPEYGWSLEAARQALEEATIAVEILEKDSDHDSSAIETSSQQHSSSTEGEELLELSGLGQNNEFIATYHERGKHDSTQPSAGRATSPEDEGVLRGKVNISHQKDKRFVTQSSPAYSALVGQAGSSAVNRLAAGSKVSQEPKVFQLESSACDVDASNLMPHSTAEAAPDGSRTQAAVAPKPYETYDRSEEVAYRRPLQAVKHRSGMNPAATVLKVDVFSASKVMPVFRLSAKQAAYMNGQLPLHILPSGKSISLSSPRNSSSQQHLAAGAAGSRHQPPATVQDALRPLMALDAQSDADSWKLGAVHVEEVSLLCNTSHDAFSDISLPPGLRGGADPKRVNFSESLKAISSTALKPLERVVHSNRFQRQSLPGLPPKESSMQPVLTTPSALCSKKKMFPPSRGICSQGRRARMSMPSGTQYDLPSGHRISLPGIAMPHVPPSGLSFHSADPFAPLQQQQQQQQQLRRQVLPPFAAPRLSQPGAAAQPWCHHSTSILDNDYQSNDHRDSRSSLEEKVTLSDGPLSFQTAASPVVAVSQQSMTCRPRHVSSAVAEVAANCCYLDENSRPSCSSVLRGCQTSWSLHQDENCGASLPQRDMGSVDDSAPGRSRVTGVSSGYNINPEVEWSKAQSFSNRPCSVVLGGAPQHRLSMHSWLGLNAGSPASRILGPGSSLTCQTEFNSAPEGLEGSGEEYSPADRATGPSSKMAAGIGVQCFDKCMLSKPSALRSPAANSPNSTLLSTVLSPAAASISSGGSLITSRVPSRHSFGRDSPLIMSAGGKFVCEPSEQLLGSFKASQQLLDSFRNQQRPAGCKPSRRRQTTTLMSSGVAVQGEAGKLRGDGEQRSGSGSTRGTSLMVCGQEPVTLQGGGLNSSLNSGLNSGQFRSRGVSEPGAHNLRAGRKAAQFNAVDQVASSQQGAEIQCAAACDRA